MTKPFHPLELVERVKAILERESYEIRFIFTISKNRVTKYLSLC